MTTSHSFFLFGGGFLRDLEPYLGNINGRMLGISPLSDVQFSEETNRLMSWLPQLDARLGTCGAEYLVLNLETAWQQLLVSGEYFLTALSENLTQLRRGEIALVDPVVLGRERLNAALDAFAQVLCRHFSSQQIILIHAHVPDYYLAGNNLRLCGKKGRNGPWMDQLEARFREKTGCAYVDVTRFYFLRKEPGHPVTDGLFERECYLDTASRIAAYLCGGGISAGRPDFALSLERYVNYYFTLHRKPQRIFLNPGYFLDEVVLAASGHFVKQHRGELLELDVLDWSEPEKTMEQLPPDRGILGILKGFWAASKGIYDWPDADYAAMLAEGLVPEKLLKDLRERYAPGAKLLPCQINKYNAGFHFAKMRGLDPKPFVTEQTVPEPVVLDVFGSCVSRTAFNVQDNDFAVENYWYHVPPFEHLNQPVAYDPAIFPEKLSWKDRLVKLQLDCGVYGHVRASRASWLLIDLYFLISPNNFRLQNCLYGDFDHKISPLLGAKRVDIYRDSSLAADPEELLHALDPWLELISEKYKKNIIVIDGPRMEYWIGDDNRLYHTHPYPECEILDRAARYVCERTGAYHIRVGNGFLSDELGYMRRTPAHKEDACYQAIHDIVRQIVDSRPEQRIFDRYPGQVQIQRLLRLMPHNSTALLEDALPLSQLDRAVIRMERQDVLRHQDALAALYDCCDESYSLDPELARMLKEAAGKPGIRGEPPLRDYPSYPREMLRFIQSTGDCCLPEFPAISGCKAVWEKAVILLRWTAPKDRAVQIFRRSSQEPWEWIGQSADGSFTDKTAQPGVEYHYRFAVKAEENGRCYLGGFTAPVQAKVAVGTPVLTSAVHLDGENILRWAPVAGAEDYRVYRKPTLRDRWQVATLTKETCYREINIPGTWYTVRALKTVKGKRTAGGFQPGIQAQLL